MADEQDLPVNDGLMDLSGFMGERDAAEEAMAKKVAESRLDQVPDAGDMAQEPFAEPQEPVEQPVVETRPDAAPVERAPVEAPREPVSEPPSDEPRYTVKVNGQDIEVPLSKLLSDYRMREASEQRFNEAARLRQEAEEIARRAQAQPVQAQPEQRQPERQPAPDVSERKKKLKEALQYGDDTQLDEIADILVAAADGRQTTTVDAAAVQQVVKAELERDARNRAFTDLASKPENRPVFEDEDLARLSRGRTLRLMAEEIITAGGDPNKVSALNDQQIAAAFSVMERAGRTRPQMELIQEAVEYTRQRFLPNAPKAPAPVDLDARRQRKASLPQLPVATGARNQPPAAPQRKSPGQIVDDERKARGQATFNVGLG